MSDKKFVEFCYKQVLRRKPDKAGQDFYVNALKSKHISREDFLIKLTTCDEFKKEVLSQEFVPPGHFYSVIPSESEKKEFLALKPSKRISVPGIKLNEKKQLRLLKKFKKYYRECPFPKNKTKKYRYYFENFAYSYTDAFTLYNMIRRFKPKRIIEIGSGFSSCAILDTNDHFFNGNIDLTFIEPYPELLHSLIKNDDKKHTILDKKIQDVDIELFKKLKKNDILFIDSTHVSKLNSDVNTDIFEILPSLNKGVIIHFHDIFWPFEYPKGWIKEGRAWNEIYLMRAFLQFNKSFEILFFADYTIKHNKSWFRTNMPRYLRNTGANLWLRKTS